MNSFYRSLFTVVTLFIVIQSCEAVYDPSSKSNVALYWGQGSSQQRLSYFCAQSTVDVIPIGFVHIFPAQGNGFPGTNFGNQCWGGSYVYPGPGNDPSLDQLQSECPNLVADIPICQSTYSKKIILSLGGGSQTYQLTGSSNGRDFADFLWGAFGPQTPSWVASGKPRPFDGPNGQAVEVDGFDFDIEVLSLDTQAGYIAMASRLRTLFKTANKPYLLTGAPQCVVPDANMGALIKAVAFDIIWVQFYNTPQCSARSWITANPNHVDGQLEMDSGFGYHNWTTFLDGTASTAAKLYIGVLGAPDANNYYLNPNELSSLADAYYCDARFGGVMIWEATSADNNAVGPYYSAVKSILTGYDSKPPRLCPLSTSTTTSSIEITTKTSTLSTEILSLSPSSSAFTSYQTTSSTKTSFISSFKTSTTKLASPEASQPTSSSKSITTSTSATKTSSKTSSSSSSPTPSAPDGACGAPYEVSCSAGYCCSQYGYCGNVAAYCATGCQPAYGICN